MIVMSAGTEVRTWKSHVGKSRSIRASADRIDRRSLDAKLLKCLSSHIHQVHMRTDLLSHIVVGICDLHLDCSLTVLRVQELADLIAECFSLLKPRHIMVTDNIVKSRVLDISADVVQMEESLIFFRVLRLLVLRQHRLEFQTDQD